MRALQRIAQKLPDTSRVDTAFADAATLLETIKDELEKQGVSMTNSRK